MIHAKLYLNIEPEIEAQYGNDGLYKQNRMSFNDKL
jgi:hypothetical protein